MWRKFQASLLIGACLIFWLLLDDWVLLAKLVWLKAGWKFVVIYGKVVFGFLVARIVRIFFRDVPTRLIKLIFWVGIGVRLRRLVRRQRARVRILMREYKVLLGVVGGVLLFLVTGISWFYFGVLAVIFSLGPVWKWLWHMVSGKYVFRFLPRPVQRFNRVLIRKALLLRRQWRGQV